jgi:hypothetical protein
MATFAMCVYCGCNEDGTAIYKCEECKKTFCDTCAEGGFFSSRCPSCDVSGYSLGKISR